MTSTGKKGCARCGSEQDHKAADCEKPYRPYNEQVCDFCSSPDHEAEDCKDAYDSKVCNKCGHRDHKRDKCRLFGPKETLSQVEMDKVNQFTPRYRQKHLDKLAKKQGLGVHAAQSPPRTSTNTPRISPSKSLAVASRSKSEPKNFQLPSPATIGRLGQKLQDTHLSDDTAEDHVAEQKRKWHNAEKTLAKPPEKRTPSNMDTPAKTNFFQIALNTSVTLHRYIITLGDVDDKTPTDRNDRPGESETKRKLKRETKTYLIQQLLIENPPKHNYWATDYDSIIISRGPLYPDQKSSAELNQITQTPHHRTGPPKQPEPVAKSFITLQEYVDVKGLNDHVYRRTVLDNPDHELQALNIISWKMINDSSFQGGRIGKKFYPDGLNSPVILVILPARDLDLYAEVKRWGDCQKGIPTVCITFDKLIKGVNDQNLRANICLKLNSKLKGTNHKIIDSNLIITNNKIAGNIPSTGFSNRTMIVGADVTHPGAGNDHCPSMAGVVATDEDDTCQYLASARLQKCRQEFISDLRGMIKERVIVWAEKAASKSGIPKDLLPTHIIFFRDGVSESQYGMVQHEEKPQIQAGYHEAVSQLKKEHKNAIPTKPSFKLTLIVVTKRHHARFYPRNDVEPGGSLDINLVNGMVADTKVVTPNHFSFYLQSPSCDKRTGTAKNAHYVASHDDKKKTFVYCLDCFASLVKSGRDWAKSICHILMVVSEYA